VILVVFKVRVAVAGGKMLIAVLALIALVWLITRSRR
jgi:hypothetical protein